MLLSIADDAITVRKLIGHTFIPFLTASGLQTSWVNGMIWQSKRKSSIMINEFANH